MLEVKMRKVVKYTARYCRPSRVTKQATHEDIAFLRSRQIKDDAADTKGEKRNNEERL
jgi:hypothetical protein